MRTKLAALVCLLGSLPAQDGQLVDPNEVLRQGIFRITKQAITTIEEKSFREWFFSEEFRTFMSSKEARADVTVPFKGIPILFSAGSKEGKAWTLWAQNKHSVDWQTSASSWEVFFQKEGDPTIVGAWRDAYIAHANAVGTSSNRLRLSGKASDDMVTLNIKITAVDGAPTPVFNSIVAVGVDSAGHYEHLLGQPLTFQGATVLLPWSKGASTCTIIVNTSIGSSSALEIKKPVTGYGMVEYAIPTRQWKMVQLRTQSHTTDNNHETGRSCNREYDIQVTAPNALRNARLVHLAGPDTHCEKRDPVISENGTRATAAILNAHTHPQTYQLQVEEWEPYMERGAAETLRFQVRGSKCDIEIPTVAGTGTASLAIRGTVVRFSLGQADPEKRVVFKGSSQRGANTLYSYEIVSD